MRPADKPGENGLDHIADKDRLKLSVAAADQGERWEEPRQSGEIYIRMTNEKRSGPYDMAKMISDPDNVWATKPLNAMRYVEFMNKVGTVKKVPADWRDLFMPEVHGLAGS